MNLDQTVSPTQQSISDPVLNETEGVDDVVAQGLEIQDLFAANSSVQDQKKSPLDMLEEILQKEELSRKEEQLASETHSNQEELVRQAQLAIQEEQLITQQREQLMAEVHSDDQKKRDQIRIEQTNSNQPNNPFQIKQLERKK